jgi:D-alanine-D-alanine ligase-like ATP-grasp enzyme
MPRFDFRVWVRFVGEDHREFPVVVKAANKDAALVQVKEQMLTDFKETCQELGGKDADIFIGVPGEGVKIVMAMRGNAAEVDAIKKAVLESGGRYYYSA